MTTLEEILNRVQEIIEIAKQFGFINIRIYKTEQDRALHLLVDLDPANSDAHWRNDYILGTYLGEELLECQVVIHSVATIKPEFEQSVYENAIELNGSTLEKITEKWQLSDSGMEFLPTDTTQMQEFELEDYEDHIQRTLLSAYRIIERWKKKRVNEQSSLEQQSTFWSESLNQQQKLQMAKELTRRITAVTISDLTEMLDLSTLETLLNHTSCLEQIANRSLTPIELESH